MGQRCITATWATRPTHRMLKLVGLAALVSGPVPRSSSSEILSNPADQAGTGADDSTALQENFGMMSRGCSDHSVLIVHSCGPGPQWEECAKW
jgi:hypothetical protein